jgi:hypothetical protein
MSDLDRLESLAGLTQQVDADALGGVPGGQPGAPGAQAAPEAPEDQGAKEWGMLMFTVGGMLQMVAPDLRAVYTEERCFEWGRCADVVAQKHGWNAPTNSPELALLASTISFAVPTVIGVRQRLAQAKALEGTLLGRLVGWWRGRKAKGQTPRQEVKAEEAKVVQE